MTTQPTYTDRELAALGAVPGICRALDETHTFMCDLDADHTGDHHGFELPTVTLDDCEEGTYDHPAI